MDSLSLSRAEIEALVSECHDVAEIFDRMAQGQGRRLTQKYRGVAANQRYVTDVLLALSRQLEEVTNMLEVAKDERLAAEHIALKRQQLEAERDAAYARGVEDAATVAECYMLVKGRYFPDLVTNIRALPIPRTPA